MVVGSAGNRRFSEFESAAKAESHRWEGAPPRKHLISKVPVRGTRPINSGPSDRNPKPSRIHPGTNSEHCRNHFGTRPARPGWFRMVLGSEWPRAAAKSGRVYKVAQYRVRFSSRVSQPMLGPLGPESGRDRPTYRPKLRDSVSIWI